MGIKHKILSNLLGLFIATVVVANPTQTSFDKYSKGIDHSDLAIDGPHVFYKEDGIVVKSISLDAGEYFVKAEIYRSKEDIPTLECAVTKDRSFDVNLKPVLEPFPSTYEQPSKLFAISDIEGNFHALSKSLIGNGVIDENHDWSFGDGHLVLVGDFFDRGLNVTACLWLIYELESQAAVAGGGVHFIIGNHEEMNLSGDHRYVRKKYAQVAAKMDCEYSQLFDENTELGRWLRTKNLIEKVGNTIFVHGGLSEKFANSGLSLDRINKIGRAHIGKSSDQLKAKGGDVALVFAKNGPLWYRGLFGDKANIASIKEILSKFDAERVCVGHTIVDDICTLHEGQVIAIDVKHAEMVANSRHNALLIRNGQLYKVNYKGEKALLDEVEGRNKPDGSVIAFKAIKEAKLPLLNKFLGLGNDVNDYYSPKNYTLLHYTIENGNTETAQHLLNIGANPDIFYQGRSSLMHAIKKNKIKMIELFLNNNVDVNLENHRQQTALHYVAKYGNVELAKVFVKLGAKLDIVDQQGLTPFKYAVKNKNIEIAKYLKSLE